MIFTGDKGDAVRVSPGLLLETEMASSIMNPRTHLWIRIWVGWSRWGVGRGFKHEGNKYEIKLKPDGLKRFLGASENQEKAREGLRGAFSWPTSITHRLHGLPPCLTLILIGLHVRLLKTGYKTMCDFIFLIYLSQIQWEANLHIMTDRRHLAPNGVSGCDPSSWHFSFSKHGCSQGDTIREWNWREQDLGVIHQ